MIPHKLTMQGFGSYLQKTEIDFDRVDGIFLIDGSTGAGKSLILDAVTYALYGRSSGDRTGMISKCLHGADRIMKVGFTFEASGKMYEFCREEKYSRPRKASAEEDSGILRQSASAFDITGERRQLNSKDTATEVNRLAEDILHMSYDQFCRIVVLPQGKIEKLLTSGSGEKEQIFTELFGTARLKEITDKLMESCNAEAKRLESVRVGLARFYSPEYESIQALRDKLNEMENTHAQNSEILKKAKEEAEAAENAEKEAGELSAEFEKLEEDEKKLSALKQRADEFAAKKAYLEDMESQKNVLPEYKAYKSAAEELELRRKNISYAEQAVKAAEDMSAETERLAQQHKSGAADAENAREEYNELTKLEEVYNKISEVKSAGTKANASYEAANKKLDNADKKRTEMKNSAAALEEEAKKYSGINYSEKISALMERHARLDNGKKWLEQYSQTAAKLETDKAELSRLEEQYCYAEAELKAAEEEYDRRFEQHLKNIASGLAAGLSEGEKCPVCGSVHHPEPAAASGERISRELLKKLKENADKLRKNASDIAHRRDVLKITSNRLEDEAAQLKKASEASGYTEEAYKDTVRSINALKKSEKERDDIQKKLSAARSGISSAESEYENAAAEEREANDRLNDLRYEYKSLSANMRRDIADISALRKAAAEKRAVFELYDKKTENIGSQLKLSAEKLTAAKVNLQNAESEFSDAERKYCLMREALEQKLLQGNITSGADNFIPDEKGIAALTELRSCCSEYETNVKNLTAETKLRREMLSGKLRPDMELLTKVKNAKTEEYNRLNILFEKENDGISRLHGLSEGYEKEAADYELAAEKLSKRKSFCDKMAGSKKMSFSRYVLGIMLDNVLKQANVMLERVLDSNYRLYKEMDGSGNAKSGLDINVVNCSVDTSGAKYSVRMLSGGEKFVMSVILGLAIASSVRNNSGGIEVNSLFIDEGFGTLDDDALREILEILGMFGSGKKIGIISHVGSLASLPTGFRVTRTAGGGSIVKTRPSEGK